MVDAVGAHPLVLQLVAGAVRKQSKRMSGAERCDDPADWAAVRQDWQRRAAAQPVRGALSDYSQPLLAFEQSCARLTHLQQHLLATLALFPPSRKVPVGAVEAVWCITVQMAMPAAFEEALEALDNASIVEVHPYNENCIVVHNRGVSLDLVHCLQQADQSATAAMLRLDPG